MRRRDAWPPGERLQRGSTSNKENAIVAVSHLQVNNSLVLLIYALSLKLLFLLQSSEVLLRPYSAIGGNGTRSPRCEWT